MSIPVWAWVENDVIDGNLCEPEEDQPEETDLITRWQEQIQWTPWLIVINPYVGSNGPS